MTQKEVSDEDIVSIVVNARHTTPPQGRLHYVLPDGTHGSSEGLLEHGIPIPPHARVVRYEAPPVFTKGATITIGVAPETKKREQAK